MKINDLTTLEILSTDELNQVSGGRGCYYKPYGRRFFRKFNRKMRKDMPKDMADTMLPFIPGDMPMPPITAIPAGPDDNLSDVPVIMRDPA